MTYLTVGVTGHIDHGKTSLVGVLTGIDTDTAPEEKRRGITIDLGFAAFREGQHTFAFIDAPGHQKYVGNLLAGVSAVDVGLLVVACDQGIQQQTLEHAAIMKSLGVARLIVALSRIDLAPDARRSELTEELEVFLADFGFDQIPIIPLSSVTGVGIDALKQELCRAADAKGTDALALSNYFRMPVDRVLNVPGRGLVVAGTIWSGQVRIGDMLQLAGHTESLRVRELEVHGEVVTQSQRGIRTAINLAGTVPDGLSRGVELVTCGTHSQAQCLLVEIAMFDDAAEVRCPATVQLHTATTSCAARITGVRKLERGKKCVAVVEPESPLVATFAQRCLFRLPYPVGSIAGGRVLGSLGSAPRKRKSLVELGEQLVASDSIQRLLAWLEFQGELALTEQWCELQLGVSKQALDESLAVTNVSDRAVTIEGRLVATRLIGQLREYILKLLAAQAQESDNMWCVEDAIVKRAGHIASPAVVRDAIRQLTSEEAIVQLNHMVALASEKTLLSKKQRANMEQLLKLYAGLRTPPTSKEATSQLALNTDAVHSLLRHATQQGVLTDLGGGLWIATDVLTEVLHDLRRMFEESPEWSVANIRDRWGVTRKHAIPLLEYCDRQSFTIRHQDMRIAGPSLPSNVARHSVP